MFVLIAQDSSAETVNTSGVQWPLVFKRSLIEQGRAIDTARPAV